MLYTGLDYHRSFSYITTMNERGEILSQKKLPSNSEIVDYLKEFGKEKGYHPGHSPAQVGTTE